MGHGGGRVRRENPMVGRLLGCVAGFVLAVSSASAAPRTVDDAVEAALANPALAALAAGRLGAVAAAVEEAAALPPPSLGVEHEQVVQPAGWAGTESTLRIEQALAPGWQAALRATAPHRRAAAQAEFETVRLGIATEVRRAFYEVRWREERLAVLAAWIERVDRVVALTAARERGGDASACAVRRVEREQATIRAERAAEAARLGEAWGALSTQTGWTERPALGGELVPAMREEGGAGAEGHPGLARLASEGRARAVEAEAWDSPMGRGWTLGAGYRLVGADEAFGHGFVVSLGMPLALWNAEQPRIDRLVSERAALAAEADRWRAMSGRAVAAARQRLADALAAVAEVPAAAADDDFSAVAESAFAAGEATLEVLLDAGESTTRLRLAALDLAWEARRAAIELDHHLGQGASR